MDDLLTCRQRRKHHKQLQRPDFGPFSTVFDDVNTQRHSHPQHSDRNKASMLQIESCELRKTRRERKKKTKSRKEEKLATEGYDVTNRKTIQQSHCDCDFPFTKNNAEVADPYTLFNNSESGLNGCALSAKIEKKNKHIKLPSIKNRFDDDDKSLEKRVPLFAEASAGFREYQFPLITQPTQATCAAQVNAASPNVSPTSSLHAPKTRVKFKLPSSSPDLSGMDIQKTGAIFKLPALKDNRSKCRKEAEEERKKSGSIYFRTHPHLEEISRSNEKIKDPFKLPKLDCPALLTDTQYHFSSNDLTDENISPEVYNSQLGSNNDVEDPEIVECEIPFANESSITSQDECLIQNKNNSHNNEKETSAVEERLTHNKNNSYRFEKETCYVEENFTQNKNDFEPKKDLSHVEEYVKKHKAAAVIHYMKNNVPRLAKPMDDLLDRDAKHRMRASLAELPDKRTSGLDSGNLHAKFKLRPNTIIPFMDFHDESDTDVVPVVTDSAQAIYEKRRGKRRLSFNSRRSSFSMPVIRFHARHESNIYALERPIMKLRYELATEGIRFELPMDIRTLFNMTPLEYLTKYTRLREDVRRSLTLAFHKWKGPKKDSETVKESKLFSALSSVNANDLMHINYKIIEKRILALERKSEDSKVNLGLKSFLGLSAFTQRKYISSVVKKPRYIQHGFCSYLEQLDFGSLHRRYEESGKNINWPLYQLLISLAR